jgi:hypothetical protein
MPRPALPGRNPVLPERGTGSGLSQDSIRNMLSSSRLTALRPVKGRVVIDRVELDAAVRARTCRPHRGRGHRNP